MFMYEVIALIALMVWPAIPIFFIPLHTYTKFFRLLGVWYYVLFFVIWGPVAGAVYLYKDYLLSNAFDFGIVAYVGMWLMAGGMALHLWASKVIGIKGTIGWLELFPPEKIRFLIKGPYVHVRHPIYLAHTLMFFGVFIMTGAISAGVIAVLDFIVSYFVIIVLEEHELHARFGKKYKEYAKKVPKFFPRLI